MTPPNPKRPPRAPRPPADPVSRPEPEVELPFDDDEVIPLQADDPRPQHVPQFPIGSRRRPRRSPGGLVLDAGRDRELTPCFGSGECADLHAPAFLYVERGPGSGQLLPLGQGALVLGRASSADLRLQHPSISRRHGQLSRHGERILLKDLGSQNGTFVNRERLSAEVELHSGDEIALGNALLRLRGPGPTPPRPRFSVRLPVSPRESGLSPPRRALMMMTLGALLALCLGLVGAWLLGS